MAPKKQSKDLLAGIRALVIDDDPQIRRLIDHSLNDYGCIVETAADGHEGLQALLQSDFDVAVVDIRMQGMDGLAFIQEGLKIWPWLGVVIITGYPGDTSIVQAKELGIEHVVAKPIDFDQLLTAVHNMATQKKKDVEQPGQPTFNQIQEHMGILRQLSEAAFSADNQLEALRSLSIGLARLLPCSVVGILDVDGLEEVMFITAQEAVSPDFMTTVKNEIFTRFESLTEKQLVETSVRVQTEGIPCDAGAAAAPGSTFTVPIITAGQVSGMLMLASKDEDVYQPSDISFLYHTANHLSTIFVALSRMRTLAVNDALTNVCNRGHLERELDRAWMLARRHEHSIAVIIVDIDEFKKHNDTYGHLVGDEILREFAAILKGMARHSDIVGRYGGDEFVLVLQYTDLSGGVVFANRVLEAVSEKIFCGTTHQIRLTPSIGVAASRDANDQEAGFDVLAEADQALYMAKNSGKSRVCQWSEEPEKRSPTVEVHPGRGGEGNAVVEVPPAHRSTVLVVDDDVNIGQLLHRILTDANYDVRVTSSIAEAKQVFEQATDGFDIVITDINLPEESGFELLHELSAADDAVIKIVISGHATVDNAIASLRYGVYDFIPKPIIPEQLLAVLDRAMKFRQLAIENARYKRHLEDMVREKSAALNKALDDVKSSYEFTLEALVAMLDAREHKTGQHSIRVRDMALILAQEMGVQGEELEIVSHGALLHDIGKIGIPDSILRKPGSLTDDEWEVIKTHPEIGYRVLCASPFLEEASEIVRSHQERWDGSGYPRALRGEEICLGARIFAIVDAYDAMRSDRYYQASMSQQDTIEEIERERGKQFDPAAVDAFLQCQPDIERCRNASIKTSGEDGDLAGAHASTASGDDE